MSTHVSDLATSIWPSELRIPPSLLSAFSFHPSLFSPSRHSLLSRSSSFTLLSRRSFHIGHFLPFFFLSYSPIGEGNTQRVSKHSAFLSPSLTLERLLSNDLDARNLLLSLVSGLSEPLPLNSCKQSLRRTHAFSSVDGVASTV